MNWMQISQINAEEANQKSVFEKYIVHNSARISVICVQKTN